MIKGFETVCATVERARAIEGDAEKVLEILRENGRPMRAKEVAEILNKERYEGSCAHTAKMLTLLKKLGLVVRTEVEEGDPIVIEMERYGLHYEDDAIVVIDGVEYIRKDATPKRGRYIEKKTIIPKVARFSLA